jgi:MATE family multidrug resistance protein
LYKEINNRILRLAIPSILANITVPLVGLTDLVIAGHIGDAIIISGIAIGSMMFDLLYWNFGFLRLGTSGFTAQAYGRRDLPGAVKVFMEAMGTAMLSALLMLVLQFPVIKYAPYVVEISPEAMVYVKQYFLTRIWAAPAVMALFVIRGWLIGMQNSMSTMIIDVVVNGANIGCSIFFAITLDMGILGIAAGTLVAQYTGLITGFLILVIQYGKLRKYVCWEHLLRLREMKNFFKVNGDIFIRSVCMLVIYCGFTIFSSKYGEEILAINTILLKLMMLYSYFLDGFAYAGEALAGRYIGAKDPPRLNVAIRLLFIWALSIGIISTIVYATGFKELVSLVTSNYAIINNSTEFYGWVIAMPIVSCLAFLWDGIYIGATASVPMRNIMIISVAAFLICYYGFNSFMGTHALWLAYIVHLILRTIGCQFLAKKSIYPKAKAT